MHTVQEGIQIYKPWLMYIQNGFRCTQPLIHHQRVTLINPGDLTVNMAIEKVLIVSKPSKRQGYESMWGPMTDVFINKHNMDEEELAEQHRQHIEYLEAIRNRFTDRGITASIEYKQNPDSMLMRFGWDLFVIFGGDGTYMDTVRYIKDDKWILPIKSSRESVGGHYNIDMTNALESIDKLLDGEQGKDFFLEERTRLKGTFEFQGVEISDLAQNEIFVGDYYNPGFSRVSVSMNGDTYETGASGIVVSTWNGRTGWFNNIHILEKDPQVLESYRKAHEKAGLKPRLVLNPSADFQEGEQDVVRYKVREHNHDHPTNQGYDFGRLQKGQKLTVTCKQFSDGMASLDGSKPHFRRSRVYPLEYDQKVQITVDEKPLYIVSFR
jgi:NAD kinase